LRWADWPCAIWRGGAYSPEGSSVQASRVFEVSRSPSFDHAALELGVEYRKCDLDAPEQVASIQSAAGQVHGLSAAAP